MDADLQSPIYVAGSSETMEGAAIARALRAAGFKGVLPADQVPETNLRHQTAAAAWFREHRPEYVFLAAGWSGGIAMNQNHSADLMRDNLQLAANVLPVAHHYGVKKLLYLASSCCYPRLAEQPMRVEALLTGPLEPTNEAYALAKLAGIKLCEAYRRQHGDRFFAAIPANPFGIGDDFSEENSHVIGALIRRMHEAKESGAATVEIWGTGATRREFLFSEDLADACLFLMRNYEGAEPINIGGGEAVSIRELAGMIQEIVGYEGELRFDASRPDGMPVKMPDSSPIRALGWQPKTPLPEALRLTYDSYLGARASLPAESP